MSDQFLGEIRIYVGSAPPSGWAFCDGQLLPIGLNTALFSLIGTTYGGNGVTNFALPNLMGAAPIGADQGNGLTYRELGEQSGQAAVTLLASEVPSHTHPLNGNDSQTTFSGPQAHAFARSSDGAPIYGSTPNANMSAAAVGSTGGGQPHNNMQPYLTLRYIIALEGTFPLRG